MTREPISILLVEDNEDEVVLTRRVLQAITRVRIVQVTRDGEETMTILRNQAKGTPATLPDLVLLDINLPKKNGLEVLCEVKHEPALRHLPIIMLTTSQREEDIVKSYSYGACSYIPKPVEVQRFLEVMQGFESYWMTVSLIPKRKSI